MQDLCCSLSYLQWGRSHALTLLYKVINKSVTPCVITLRFAPSTFDNWLSKIWRNSSSLLIKIMRDGGTNGTSVVRGEEFT